MHLFSANNWCEERKQRNEVTSDGLHSSWCDECAVHLFRVEPHHRRRRIQFTLAELPIMWARVCSCVFMATLNRQKTNQHIQAHSQR